MELMNAGGFADILADILDLEDDKEREKLKKKVALLTLSKAGDSQSKVQEVSLGDGKFYTIYGFLAGVTDRQDGTLTVVYAFHKLQFSFPTDEGFEPSIVEAINNHYCKEKA